MKDFTANNGFNPDGPGSGEKSNPAWHPRSGFYEIRVRGQLDGGWSDWLDGMEVRLSGNEETVLSGCVEDQAALIGILNRIHGLNLTLLSVRKEIRSNQAGPSTGQEDT